MKKGFKKILAFILALTMMFGAAPLAGLVGLEFPSMTEILTDKAEAATYGYLTYEINNEEVTITDCSSSVSGVLEIPSSIEGYPVTSIGDYAFYDCIRLASVNLGENSKLTSIGNYVFYNCKTLTSITIPDSVTSIGDSAFSDCSGLTSITIPDSVTSIGDSAFYQCYGLTSITISNSVTSIGDYVFYNCFNLTSITIPDSVTSIGDSVFCNCSSLTSITIPDSVTSIGDSAFYYTSIYKNGSNWVNGVLYIGNHLIDTKKDISGTYAIKSGTKTIADRAFDGCSGLTSITIPNSVTSIGNRAFYYCTGLTDVIFMGSEKEWEAIEIGKENDNLLNATIHFQNLPEENIYNLGEETYSFINFGDSDSPFGHCFGMSVTSSGYYTGELDISSVGGSSEKSLYSLNRTSAVTKPICYYQDLQGSFSNYSIVAGGSYYLSYNYDIESDWEEVINYVKNHKYDNKGNLQIGFRKNNEGGHAINFLYYKEVNGQQRIYVYDNNFPEVETYFYKNSNGDILQAPRSTFSGSIDCIALRSVERYYSVVDSAEKDRFVYGSENDIRIDGIKGYLMELGKTDEEMLMYEIPEGKATVAIIPLQDNATFTYLGTEYSFGKVNDDTKGILVLGELEGNTVTETPEFNIVNGENMSIRVPSTTSISYGDSIILHADVNGTLPEGARIEWTASNGNFDMSVSADGTTCKISPKSSGKTVFTATVYDKDGNVVSTDTQEMTAKAGFFDKIVAFFKKIFGLTKVIPQAFKLTY